MLGSLLVARLLCGDVTSSWYGKNLSLAWKKPLVWKEHGTVFQPLRSRYSGTWWMSGVSWFTENRRKSISGQGIVCNRALRLGQVSVTSLQSHRKNPKLFKEWFNMSSLCVHQNLLIASGKVDYLSFWWRWITQQINNLLNRFVSV